jgi:hypothetical protein
MSKAPSNASVPRSIFPPRPVGIKGRSGELNTGGSGKSMLAAALGRRPARC